MSDAKVRVQNAIEEALDAALPGVAHFDADARLVADVGLDSVQIMNLVMEIEDRLNLSIPLELLAEVQSLGELSIQLESLLEDRV